MYISVVICTYNRSDLLKKCISSIFNNKCSLKNYEVIVIDNNSIDDTKVIVEKFMENHINIKYIFEENVGLSFARNRGIKESNGDIIVFLDDDTIMYENYMESVYNFCKNNINFVFAAGKINPVWKEKKPEWFTNEFASIVGETQYGNKDRILDKNEMPIGANMIFNKKIFGEVGYFNTDLGMKGKKLYLGEESDIYNKILKKGYEVHYISSAIVDHAVHKNKVDKNYIMNRLELEGITLAQMHLNEENNLTCFLFALKRCVILIVRDLMSYLLKIFSKSKKFEKQCKIKRSYAYIKKILNGLVGC